MYTDQGHSDEHWRIQDSLEYLNLNNNNSAEELLQSTLTSTDILTWNSKGDIRGTDIVDLVRYCLMPYNQDIPEPAGLSLFLKGLAELEIDKSLIANGLMITRSAHKDHVPMKDFDDSETVSDCTQDSDALSDVLSMWTRLVTIVTNIYTFPIWGRVLYAHGQIFIQIAWGATV